MFIMVKVFFLKRKVAGLARMSKQQQQEKCCLETNPHILSWAVTSAQRQTKASTARLIFSAWLNGV